ncbi:MAG: GTP cyclohydrolase [Crocinitomicaceae bacterium]|nr:GTP cyclohydrolase [Crocinitomicaceae bacterium]
MRKMNQYAILATLSCAVAVASCKKDEVVPEEENVVEVFTDVKLIFTNAADPSDVVEARAQDPDGEGVQGLAILDEITLGVDKTYNLTYEIANNLTVPGEDIGAEILEEDNEHQFFYTFTNNAFSNPAGNGNVDNASDPLNYSDLDENGLPVGLLTQWTTPSTALSGGVFTARLQHQPDVKTASSGSNDGDTDFDLTFVLNIQ